MQILDQLEVMGERLKETRLSQIKRSLLPQSSILFITSGVLTSHYYFAFSPLFTNIFAFPCILENVGGDKHFSSIRSTIFHKSCLPPYKYEETLGTCLNATTYMLLPTKWGRTSLYEAAEELDLITLKWHMGYHMTIL